MRTTLLVALTVIVAHCKLLFLLNFINLNDYLRFSWAKMSHSVPIIRSNPLQISLRHSPKPHFLVTPEMSIISLDDGTFRGETSDVKRREREREMVLGNVPSSTYVLSRSLDMRERTRREKRCLLSAKGTVRLCAEWSSATLEIKTNTYKYIF